MERIGRGWRTAIPFSTGEFIRRYLTEHGEAYVYEMWNSFRKAVEDFGVKWWGSYDSFRRYVHICKRLGLIRPVRTERSARKGLKARRYYALVPEHSDSEAWARPQEILYPATVYGGARYEGKKEKAFRLGITVEELALREHPDIMRIRGELAI